MLILVGLYLEKSRVAGTMNCSLDCLTILSSLLEPVLSTFFAVIIETPGYFIDYDLAEFFGPPSNLDGTKGIVDEVIVEFIDFLSSDSASR